MIESVLLVLMFVGVIFGQFGRIEVSDKLINIYIHEIGMALFVAVQFIRLILKKESIRSILLKNWHLALFIVWAHISFLISIHLFSTLQNSISYLYLLRLMLYAIFAILVVKYVSSRTHRIVFIHTLLHTFSWILLVASFIQYFAVTDLWHMYQFGWDPHQYRIFGTYLDVFVAACMFGLLSIFWYKKNKYFLSFLLCIALLLTFSRSAYIATFMSFMYMFVLERKWRRLGFFVALFLLLFMLAPKKMGEGVNIFRTSTINSRIRDVALATTVFLEKPVEGYGYNRLRYVKEQKGLLAVDDRSHTASAYHSSYAIIATTMGSIGLFLFIILAVRIFGGPTTLPYGILLGIMALFDNVLLYGMIVYLTIMVVLLSHPLSKKP